jgi:SAM-dependent methyltransferase
VAASVSAKYAPVGSTPIIRSSVWYGHKVIEPNIYCKVSGMTMRCISQLNSEGTRLPKVVEIGCADGQGTQRYAGFCGKTVAVDAMLKGRPDIEVLADGKILVQEVGVMARSQADRDQDKIDAFLRRTEGLNVDLVIGFSTDADVVNQVADSLIWGPGDDLADIVIIDGCHHPFEAVWKDVEIYRQFVRPGGFLILDDLYEECILQVLERAVTELGYVQFDRWSVKRPDILQDCAALRRPIS